LEFNWAKRVPCIGEGVKGEPFEDFALGRWDNVVITVTELLGECSCCVFWPNINKGVKAVIILNGMHKQGSMEFEKFGERKDVEGVKEWGGVGSICGGCYDSNRFPLETSNL
jgi:hypothetical protein